MYQIGDRVRCLVDKPENNGHIVCGSTGTVVYCEGNIVFVSCIGCTSSGITT